MWIYRPPRPDLRPFVSLLWAGTADAAGSSRLPQREHVLPTGAMHLVFRLGDTPLRLFAGAHDRLGTPLGPALIGGARAMYYAREVTLGSGSVGAMLRPGAARSLLGAPADAFAHRHTELDDVWGRQAGSLRERLLDADEPEAQLVALEDALAERVPTIRGMHPAVADAMSRLAIREPVHAVVERSGYSHRHFIRLFRDEVGLTPAAVSRILRFQRALALVQREAVPWATIAATAGYSDQSHFNREFAAVTGMTPSRYRLADPAAPNHVPLAQSG
jgi:AraC-like DNA-binding protein